MKLRLFAALFSMIPVMLAAAEINVPMKYTFEKKRELSELEKKANLPEPVVVKETTMTVKGKEYPALHFKLSKSQKNGATLRFKLDPVVDMVNSHPTLYYYARTSNNLQVPITIAVVNHLNQTISQPGRVAQKKQGDDFFTFSRNLFYHPPWGQFRDLRQLKELTLSVDVNALPKNADDQETDSMEVTITLPFFTEECAWSDRPEQKAKFLKWLNWIDTWQPDLSDSSHYLEPPKTGRIANPIALTIKGKPNAEIIYQNDKDGIVKNAAKEMQKWFKAISGATLPILEKPGTMPVKIYLDSEEGKKKFAADMKTLEPDGKEYKSKDGYFIRTDGNNIYIGGLLPQSALFGTFAFIENNTDLIFAKTNPDFGTVYSQNPDIKIVWADVLVRTKVKFRGFLGTGPDKAWQARNGMNYIGGEWGQAHEFANGLLESYLFHDEFAALVGNPKDGYTHRKVSYYGAQACLREEAYQHVLEEMKEKIEKRKKEGKMPDVMMIGNEDNWNVCCCDACTQPITLPDGTVLTSNKTSDAFKMSDPKEQRYRSNQYWMFINRLSKDIRKVYPTVAVGAMAYFFMEVPPDIPIEESVYYKFCPLYSRGDFRNPVYSPTNPTVYRNRNGLLKCGGHMDQYEYYYFLPVAEVYREDCLDGLEHGMEGFAFEWMIKHWEFPEMLGQDWWVMARIQWDPTQNVEQLRKYYMRRTYHEGAPVAEKLILGLLKQHYGGVWSAHGLSWPWNAFFDKGHGEELRKLFKETVPKIKNKRARLSFGRLMLEFEGAYQAYLNKKNKVKPPKSEITNQKACNMILDNLGNQMWGMPGFNFSENLVGYMTTVEEKGKFFNALRLKYTPKKSRKDVQYIIGSTTIRAKNPVALPGMLQFKIKALTPGKPGSAYPFFGVCGSDSGVEYAFPDKHYKVIGNNLVEVNFMPAKAGVPPDGVKAFRFMYNNNSIGPKGAEFLVYDFKIVPAMSKDDLKDEMNKFDDDLLGGGF
ncbi:MAG: DUF4838 domain-containing protein [Lentisphaeria bacterium]|nr:DUF4838 domain-containing protein [Lentisphaeria bacterium]